MSNKTATKRNARNARNATPQVKASAATAVTIPRSMHSLIVADAESLLDVHSSQRDNYLTFSAVIYAVNWSSAEYVKAVNEDIRSTFWDVDVSGMSKRMNVINNAFKVAHGGTVDDKTVQGIGVKAMLALVEDCDGINALQKAMADAKPEAMKDKRGGNRATPATPAGNVKADNKAVNAPVNAKTAFEAACNVLEACEKFLKPSDRVLLDAIDNLVSMLETHAEKIAA